MAYGKIGICLGILVVGLATRAPAGPGQAPAMPPCPESPNCVSSQSPAGRHFVQPLVHKASDKKAYQALVDILGSLKRVRIVAQKNGYIHAEFASRLFGFVDDVEFFFGPAPGTIHLRSASRTGYYDFGANQRRVAHLRKLFAAALSP